MSEWGIERIPAEEHRTLVTKMLIDLIVVADPGAKTLDVDLGIVDEIGRVAPFRTTIELTAIHFTGQLFVRMRIRKERRDRGFAADKEIAIELCVVFGGSTVLPESI